MKTIIFLLPLYFVLSKGYGQGNILVAEKSTVRFSIKNFGISTGGEFSGLQGALVFDPGHPENMSVEASIDAASINTEVDSRDHHLKQAEYLDVAHYPRISFLSENVHISSKPENYRMTGKLTIKGITRELSFPFTVVPQEGGYRLEGSFQIDRRDYGVGGNSFVLGDRVTVTLSVYAKKG
jgi:polyisoprenoid-binding protein YceI